MKKVAVLILAFLCIVSCKNDDKSKEKGRKTTNKNQQSHDTNFNKTPKAQTFRKKDILGSNNNRYVFYTSIREMPRQYNLIRGSSILYSVYFPDLQQTDVMNIHSDVHSVTEVPIYTIDNTANNGITVKLEDKRIKDKIIKNNVVRLYFAEYGRYEINSHWKDQNNIFIDLFTKGEVFKQYKKNKDGETIEIDTPVLPKSKGLTAIKLYIIDLSRLNSEGVYYFDFMIIDYHDQSLIFVCSYSAKIIKPKEIPKELSENQIISLFQKLDRPIITWENLMIMDMEQKKILHAKIDGSTGVVKKSYPIMDLRYIKTRWFK